MTTTEPANRIFLFSVPRTTSNLLMKLFSQSPKVVQSDYNFMFASMFGPQSFWIPPASMPAEAKAVMREQYKDHYFQSKLDDLEKFIREGEEQGKTVIMKEHTHVIFQPKNNISLPNRESIPDLMLEDKMLDLASPDSSSPAVSPEADSSSQFYLPTRLLLTFTPTFIIRHPGRVVPSFLRAGDSMGMSTKDLSFSTMIGFSFPRTVFEWYCAHSPLYKGTGKKPTIIDADDLVTDTQGVMKRWCEALGLKEEEIVSYDWESKGLTGIAVMDAFAGVINTSKGVIKDPKTTKPVDLMAEYESWKQEFGEDKAADMKAAVENNMADYEYLKQFKL